MNSKIEPEQTTTADLKNNPLKTEANSIEETETIPLVKSGSSGDENNTRSLSVLDDKLQAPCKLCLDEVELDNIFKLSHCGCSFCTECMKIYIEVLVKDGIVLSISCPDAECKTNGILTSEEIEKLSLPETKERYRRLKFEQEVSVDPHRTFCPLTSCSTVCHVCIHQPDTANIPPNNPLPVLCPTCQLQFCYICKSEWKSGHKCDDFSRTLGSGIQMLQHKAGFGTVSESSIKRCPVCNILIEKDRGCAQMICKSCSHVFCWYCLTLLDNDFMLRHYDKGPCRNMLGHSRAQVIRHRIGVVGLFAAFSLLLVVASPVLIIAAPIVLCCKCKECCQQVINRANQHREAIELQIPERNNKDPTNTMVAEKSNE